MISISHVLEKRIFNKYNSKILLEQRKLSCLRKHMSWTWYNETKVYQK